MEKGAAWAIWASDAKLGRCPPHSASLQVFEPKGVKMPKYAAGTYRCQGCSTDGVLSCYLVGDSDLMFVDWEILGLTFSSVGSSGILLV